MYNGPLSPRIASSLFLGRDTSIDALIEGTARWVHGEFLFVLLEHLDVIARQIRDLVNVFDIVVGSIAGNLTSRGRIHSR